MNIFLVGNGPTTDLNSIIDAGDVVIRMNKVPTFGKTTGTKTDILVLVNTGTPGEELLSAKGVAKNKAFKLARQIRLPVAPARCIQRRIAYPERAAQLTEFSHLTKLPAYDGKIISFVPYQILMDLEAKLDSPVPSTGMIMTEQLVQTRQPGDTIHICGFAHEGWDGHPWAKEKALTDSYVEQGLLVRLS